MICYAYLTCSFDFVCVITLLTMIRKETVADYINDGSPVYNVFLDATKAFDRVEYCKLFGALLTRDLSPVFVRVLFYTGWPKNWHNFCKPELHQILTDFHNYFTVRIRRKLVIILSLKIPLHLKYVATLPCEMSKLCQMGREGE